MLVNGRWTAKWDPVQAKDSDGRFIRQTSSFRHWVTRDGAPGPTGNGGFAAEPGRYHLYVALICPWASRALMVRALKGLEDVISVSVVNPELGDEGWRFGGFAGADLDVINGRQFMHEVYTLADATFTGRATVPVLWDKHTQTIVNNESADIIRMLNSAFVDYAKRELNLYPAIHAADIDTLNTALYRDLNNGVYQAGFASSQAAYEEAFSAVFAMLDTLEDRLADGRTYLFGDQLTESDVRLFVTLVRFDLAYQGLFKCNRNTLSSMRHLQSYMQRIMALPGVADTVNEQHIKHGYYSIKALNPNGIVPAGPRGMAT